MSSKPMMSDKTADTLQRWNEAPYSQEAEEALIGAVLVNPMALLKASTLVSESDFFSLRCRLIWGAMLAIQERGESIDAITVSEQLRSQKKLDEIGGAAMLTRMVNVTADSGHADVYAQLIRRLALRRAMLEASAKIKTLALDETRPIDALLLEGMQALDSIQADERAQYVPGRLSMQRYDEIIENLSQQAQNGQMTGYPLPKAWGDLSEAVPMFYPGDFVVISGAPGSGKSAMLESLAEHFAGLSLPVHYIHTEMSTAQLLHRQMARHSGLSYHTLASGAAPYAKILAAQNDKIQPFARNIAYHWLPDVPMPRLAQELRRSAERGTKFFFIDHFQDVQPPAGSSGRNEIRAFEEMCIWLAAFAEKRGVVLVLASQQNEQGKTKWTKKLIEKAVVWWSIKRRRLTSDYSYVLNGVEFRSLVGEDSPEVWIEINKARFGKKAKVKMLYHGPCFAWMDMAAVRRVWHGTAQKIISMMDDEAKEGAAT